MFEKRKRTARCAVLGALHEAGLGEPVKSYDLLKATGLSGSRLYTALAGLQNEGVAQQVPIRTDMNHQVRGWMLTLKEARP